MTIVLQIAIDAISLGSLYALTALGIGLIFGILRLINFAHGDFITIGAFALIVPSAAVVASPFIGAWPFWALIPAIILIVIVLALAAERIAFRPLRGANPATLLIASFAVSYVLQHVILLIYTGRPKSVDIGGGLTEHIALGELRVPVIQIVTIAVSVALLVGLAVFMRRTTFGVQMRAAAEDFHMARLLGVRANTVIALAFGISGLLAGVVSLIYISQTGMLSFRMSLQLVMVAFIATVIGGMGSLVGAAVGGFVVGIASVALQAVLPEDAALMRDAFIFGFVILVLMIRPQGLIITRAARQRV
ncbi:MAG: branched-chain amino acid ABC transporter permease [Alphaproteobacteria bacterium]|nr:branched-chain amino acid ABC transporter permease [Alphaproteobacteria bacterium]